MRRTPVAAVAVALLMAPLPADAQRGRGAAADVRTARSDAAIDITGTWTAVISEDWPLRMITPAKGDYTRMPLTAAARKAADAWDPARDEAAGEQCKAYGAPAIMRLPGRLRIAWQNDTTLRLELEAGTQTRTFHFDAAPAAPAASWQGVSLAEWQYTRVPPRTGELKVVTNRLRSGYLRKNGVPDSENTRLEEYFETFTEPNGDQWLLVTTIVNDPRYLNGPYVTTYPFKKIADRAGWDPTPCRVDEPR
jgi:hypothetical protein